MLNNNLYRITNFSCSEGKVEADITIDISHDIFEGHFPGQPVLPGVCMMQIFKELVEKAVDQKLILYEAGTCKFLSMVDPRITPHLIFLIEYSFAEGFLIANGILKKEEAVFLKLGNCNFRVV